MYFHYIDKQTFFQRRRKRKTTKTKETFVSDEVLLKQGRSEFDPENLDCLNKDGS